MGVKHKNSGDSLGDKVGDAALVLEDIQFEPSVLLRTSEWDSTSTLGMHIFSSCGDRGPVS